VCYSTADLLYIYGDSCLQKDCHLQCFTVQQIYCTLLVIAVYRETECLSCTVCYLTAHLLYSAGYSCLQRDRVTVIYSVLPHSTFIVFCWLKLLTDTQRDFHVNCVTLQHIYSILLEITAYRVTVIYSVLPYSIFTVYCWWNLLTDRQIDCIYSVLPYSTFTVYCWW
jgi:hypothetical protein